MEKVKKETLHNYSDKNNKKSLISRMTNKKLVEAIKFIRKKAKKGFHIFYQFNGDEAEKTIFGKEVKVYFNYKGCMKEYKKRIKQLLK